MLLRNNSNIQAGNYISKNRDILIDALGRV